MLVAAVILHWKNQESWDLSQGRDINRRGISKSQGRGSWCPPLLLGRLPHLAFSQEGSLKWLLLP